METKRKGAKVQCDGWKGLDTREGEGHGLAGLIFLAAKYRSTQGKAKLLKNLASASSRVPPARWTHRGSTATVSASYQSVLPPLRFLRERPVRSLTGFSLHPKIHADTRCERCSH